MKKLTLATLTLAAISTTSSAASMLDINRFSQMMSGIQGNFYAGGVVGLTDYDSDIEDTAAVKGARAGFEFSPYLSAELGYVDMGTVDINDEVTLSTSTLYVGLKPTLPIGFFDLYARAGAHSWDGEVEHRLGGKISNSGTDFMYGAR